MRVWKLHKYLLHSDLQQHIMVCWWRCYKVPHLWIKSLQLEIYWNPNEQRPSNHCEVSKDDILFLCLYFREMHICVEVTYWRKKMPSDKLSPLWTFLTFFFCGMSHFNQRLFMILFNQASCQIALLYTSVALGRCTESCLYKFSTVWTHTHLLFSHQPPTQTFPSTSGI